LRRATSPPKTPHHHHYHHHHQQTKQNKTKQNKTQQPADVKVPVQAHFGALDALDGFSDPKSAAALADKMRAAGKDFELFMCGGRGGVGGGGGE
jgi:hypothetical protein